MPRAPNHWEAPKSPNDDASKFFNILYLLPKDLRFEHGVPNLFLVPGAITSVRPWPRVQVGGTGLKICGLMVAASVLA